MFCKNCGKEVNDEAVVCTNCGVMIKDIPSQTQKSNGEENAIGLVGFILSFFVTIAGLICSIIGYKKARDEGAKYKGLSLAGIIISSVSIGMGVLAILFWIVFFASLPPEAYYVFII